MTSNRLIVIVGRQRLMTIAPAYHRRVRVADCDGHPQNCCRKNTPKKSQVENALAKRTSRRKTSRFKRLDGGSSAAVGPGQRPSKTAENRLFPSFSWSRECRRGP